MPQKSRRNAEPGGARDRPLAGASVIVTRPVGAATTLKRRIAALGGVALGLPGSSLRALTATAALQAELRAAVWADRVIFTSPAAVRFAWLAGPGMRFARRCQVLAVGASTAAALARRGVSAVARPQRQDSEGLLALPPLSDLRGLRVVVVGAPGGRELLPQELRRRGAQLREIAVYRRGAARLDRRHLRALETAAMPCLLLLSSQQTLENLYRALPPATWARLQQAEVIASSARIAGLARDYGFATITLARSAQTGDLLAAAIAALSRHRL